ncbi:MBL fold metallo-hydrolase [Elongatibacter sediminis]|uniref:beta-lactamase n=1 Tax=Elongatibacter sediminis TaxID=3119006 RepID=A0AAW9RIT0_9GAMM
MNTRAIRTLVAIFTALSSLPALAQRDFSEVRIETVPLGSGLYVLIGSGGNIGLATGDDGAFVIDDQFAPLTDKIRTAIAAVTERDVQFVLNTHWHGDHTGGNENFADAGALIVAHDNTRTRMQSEQFVRIFEHSAAPAPAGALPVVTFASEMTFHWNGKTIRGFHVEHAHTDGDVIVQFVEDDVFHMGDTFWTSGYPRIDAGNGGNVKGVIAAARAVLSRAGENARIIPGHGAVPDAGTGTLESYLAMLENTADAVQKLVDRGLDEEAAVAARPTAAFDAEWGQGYVSPERFVRSLWVSLAE